ncbi:hypothetical protein FRC03_010654 [Tulasnella sp. 419]|nr:hypothetical protein FRC03_010654 [Tulasnella sp. 419]
MQPQISFPPYYWPIIDGMIKHETPVYCSEMRTHIAPAKGHFSIVKRYSIEDRFGKPTGEEVAMKALVPIISRRNMQSSSSLSEEVMRRMSTRLWREREIHLKLCHNNVAPLIGFYEDFKLSSWCLVTPWYYNGTVRTFTSNPERFAERSRLLYEAGLGLAYLHSEEVVHGDIKSTNVLVDSGMHARIIDFGVSYSVKSRTLPDGSSCIAAAQQWMAPELHNPRHYSHLVHPEIPTPKSDVWSFGCLALEIYSNADPYKDVDREKVCTRIIPPTGPYFPPGSPGRYPEVDNEQLWQLCDLCWDFTVETRPEMQHVLDFISAGL